MLTIKSQSSLVYSEPADSAVGAEPANGNSSLDDYDFLRTLGKGFDATVYLVREKHTPRLYALKAFHKSTYNSKARIREVALNTAINEKDALTELSGNDFTLPLYASFHDAENYYLVTEYFPGGDLQKLFTSKALGVDTLNVEAVRFYMAELLVAIEHVHAHNIIHRDIKPDNVFIDTDGHIVLGDFGTAWLFGDCAQKPHGLVGTPAFSAPEVLTSHDYGFEVDLWAFGVTLYKMLSGREPFQSNTAGSDGHTRLYSLSKHIFNDVPVFVESPLMTEDAANLVKLLLAKCPAYRLSDITEIKNHPFFGTIDWTGVASRSLTPPWVPRLVSTRRFGVHFKEPIVRPGEQYTASDDPLPTFTSRAAPCLLSRASERRQHDFGVLEGSAPLVSWIEGSSCMEEMACHTPTQKSSLKALSGWIMRCMRALNCPLSSA